MAVTAPTPPVPPTPPAAPAFSSNANTGSETAITPPNADFVGAVKQAESIGTAIFGPGKSTPASSTQQGQPSTSADAPAAQGAPKATAANQAKTSSQANAPAQIPAASTGQTETQTSPPPANMPNSNASAHNMVYWPFAAALIVIGAGLLFRYIYKKTAPHVPDKPVAEPPAATTSPSREDPKSHFEVRI